MWSVLVLALVSPSTALVLPTRRAVIGRLLLSPAALVLSGTDAAVAAPDLDLRKYSALAPLGGMTAVGTKHTGLSLEELAATLKRDLTVGATGKGGYFVSGDLSPEIFRDDARFADPTNVAEGLSRYIKALGLLFDPACSTVELLKGPSVDAATRTITAELRSKETLKLPWRPKVRPWLSYMASGLGLGNLASPYSNPSPNPIPTPNPNPNQGPSLDIVHHLDDRCRRPGRGAEPDLGHHAGRGTRADVHAAVPQGSERVLRVREQSWRRGPLFIKSDLP